MIFELKLTDNLYNTHTHIHIHIFQRCNPKFYFFSNKIIFSVKDRKFMKYKIIVSAKNRTFMKYKILL